MSRRLVTFFSSAALVVGSLLMAAGPVLAQRGGHGGGFRGGSYSGFRSRYGGGYYGYGRGFSGYGFGRGYYGYGRGFSGYGRGFYGGFFPGYYGYGRRFYPGFYSPGFYGYGLGSSPGFYRPRYGLSYAAGSSSSVPSSTLYSDTVVSGYYSPPAVAAASTAGPAGRSSADQDNTSLIRMKLHANAEVWFDGVKTSQTGPVRDFVSPPLDPGKSFDYQIRVRWTENGRPVEQQRTVTVRPNGQTVVDLTSPAPGPELLPIPVTR